MEQRQKRILEKGRHEMNIAIIDDDLDFIQALRHEVMTLEMRDRENIEKGIEQGRRKLIVEA